MTAPTRRSPTCRRGGARAGLQHAARQGLIRVGIGIPLDAEFELVKADDPYGFASAAELSLFRRPLASTNLRFLSTVMWDGRETFRDAGIERLPVRHDDVLRFALHSISPIKSNSATIGHAQGTVPLTTEQRAAIVDFELRPVHGAAARRRGRRLRGRRRPAAGRAFLSGVASYFGINDTLVGDYRTPLRRSRRSAMTLYQGWQSYLEDSRRADPEQRDRGVVVARRADRARRGAVQRQADRDPPASRASTTTSTCRRSSAPARPATTRRMPDNHSVPLGDTRVDTSSPSCQTGRAGCCLSRSPSRRRPRPSSAGVALTDRRSARRAPPRRRLRPRCRHRHGTRPSRKRRRRCLNRRIDATTTPG